MSEAKIYKEHGCTHVRVNTGTNYPEPRIDRAFKSYYHMKRDEMKLQLGEERIYEYLPIGKAIKKGF